jgi:transcription antitermination factor NusG
MSTTRINPAQTQNPSADVFSRTLWYAAYTASRHEKRVAEQLHDRSIEHFLPLYETIHRWRNGRHRVQLPLFPGYVFVHIALRDRLPVLKIPGLVRLVGFSGVPFPLPEQDIEAMRNALSNGVAAEPYPYLTAGSRVEICNGPLQGMRGILLRRRNNFRVVLSIDLIMRSMVVEVEAADVVPVKGACTHPAILSDAAKARIQSQPPSALKEVRL